MLFRFSFNSAHIREYLITLFIMYNWFIMYTLYSLRKKFNRNKRIIVKLMKTQDAMNNLYNETLRFLLEKVEALEKKNK